MVCACQSKSKFVVVISQSIDQNTRIIIYSIIIPLNNLDSRKFWEATAIIGVLLLRTIDYGCSNPAIRPSEQMDHSVLETTEFGM